MTEAQLFANRANAQLSTYEQRIRGSSRKHG